MKVIIAGSRSITDYAIVRKAVLLSGFAADITEVVSGGARGVDRLGEKWAYQNGIRVTQFNAEWAKYGRAAGMRRNTEMAQYADAAIIVWDGESHGAQHMNVTMHNLGKPVYRYTP